MEPLPEPLAESSPKTSRSASSSQLLADILKDENYSDGSDSDSLGEELLNDFQLLVSDARDKSRSMSSLDGWNTPSISPEKVKVLESCIQDLDQQKEVLFSTISKLECSSAQRALGLGKKLSAARLEIKDLQEKSVEDGEIISQAQEEIVSLRDDVETLVGMLSTAFCDGNWQFGDAELHTVDADRLPGKLGALSVEGLQVLKLRTKLNEQRGELEAFRQEVTRLRDLQTADIQQQFEQLQSELLSCRTQGEGLHGQLSVREAELQQLNDEMTRLTQKIAAKDQTTADDQALIQQLQQQYELCVDETTKLKSTIEELEPQVSSLTREVTRLEKELAVSQCNSDVAQEQVDDLKRDLEEAQRDAAQDASTWQAELERRDEVLDQLRQELCSCRAHYNDSTHKVHEHEEKISQLELLQAQCTSDILEREKAIAELEASLKKTEDQAETELLSLQERKEEVERQLHCRDQLLGAISAEVSAIRRHYKDCCGEMESLDARQHELAEQRSAIDQACTVHHAQIAEIKQELFTLDESVGVSSDTVDGLAVDLSSALAAHRSASPASPDGDHPSLHGSLELRNATLLDLRQEIEQCQQLYARVTDHIDGRKSYIESVQPAYEHSVLEVESCRTKIEDLQRQISQLKELRSVLESQLSAKDEAVVRLRQERERNEHMYDTCKQQVDSREQAISKLTAEHDDVQAQVAAHVESIYDLRCQSSSSEMLADIAGNTDADEDTVFLYQSKFDDYQRLISENVPTEHPAFGSSSSVSSLDERQQILMSAMVQREEALAWLHAHQEALRRLKVKKADDVERRRQRIVQLEQSLGVVK